jgi:hypothetical protein
MTRLRMLSFTGSPPLVDSTIQLRNSIPEA